MAAPDVIGQFWEAVGGPADALDAFVLSGRDAWLGGPLAVDDLAVGAVAAALLAAGELAVARTGCRPLVELSGEHVALSFVSERHLQAGGAPAGGGFAPLSRMVRCAGGGWARTHANYPHHAAALAGALGLDRSQDGEAGVGALEAAAARWDAVELEDAVVGAGGCAAALRSADVWREHPAGRACAGPLIAWDEGLRVPADRGLSSAAPASRPCDGVRVLDLTRVIAGPVAGRTLAALGADVLRVDPPDLPEIAVQHLDTGPGKRSAMLDLADIAHREALLAGADAIVIGYRPGALDRFGLAAEALTERHPHLVQVHLCACLCAWGSIGPWANRRGFDSLVQVATGIAAECAVPDGAPGVLPAQALDHATGHLAAAVMLRGLTARAVGEAVAPVRLSLARRPPSCWRSRVRQRGGRMRPAPATPTATAWRSVTWR